MAKRNTYTPEYKAKIVIEILEGEQTISEIASREGINVNQLKNWKKEFLENASRAFNGSKSEKEAKRAAENAKKREEKLMQKIGHSEEEMLRVSMSEPYYRKVPILITCCPCCNEFVKLDQVTYTHETYEELKNKHRITLERLAKYNRIYPLKFKCSNSRFSIDMKNRIENQKSSSWIVKKLKTTKI